MNFNFHFSRYTFLMVIVAVFFVLLVIKAFTYLPESQGDALFLQNAKNKMIYQPAAEDVEEGTAHVRYNEEQYNNVDTEDKTDALFDEADQYLKNGDYERALSIYLNIISVVDDSQKYAECYDGIVKIYYKQGKYEKAIEKAKLANKYEPNDMRKLTLVKLYHKIGDTFNEQNMLSEILDETGE